MTGDRAEIKVRLDPSGFVRSAAQAQRTLNELGRAFGRPSRVDFRLELKRLRYRASRWHRNPSVTLWAGREVDYQLAAADDRRHVRRGW